MITVLVLVVFGGAFAAFALLGPAERAQVCDHARPGDPKCEHCPLDAVQGALQPGSGSVVPAERGVPEG
jgi:hypothetical protein